MTTLAYIKVNKFGRSYEESQKKARKKPLPNVAGEQETTIRPFGYRGNGNPIAKSINRNSRPETCVYPRILFGVRLSLTLVNSLGCHAPRMTQSCVGGQPKRNSFLSDCTLAKKREEPQQASKIWPKIRSIVEVYGFGLAWRFSPVSI
jgi:hypothetical protein